MAVIESGEPAPEEAGRAEEAGDARATSREPVALERVALERVAVVIPARNEEDYIQAALASVAAQRYPLDRLECIVVNNGSIDGTTRIAMEFAARCPDLRVTVVDEPAPGVGRAKNLGARIASGKLVIFLDADSRMDPALTQEAVTCYRQGHRAGSIRIVADSDAWMERGFFALMELGSVLFDIRSEMFYCDRELFLRLGGFRDDLHIAEDLEFLQRVKEYARQRGLPNVCHIRATPIATSPRRLRRLPWHLSILTTFARWALAFAGIGRKRTY